MKLRILTMFTMTFFTTACMGYIRDVQKRYIVNHLSKLQSYHGTLIEGGALPSGEDLISEISYQKPDQYFVVVTSPEKLKGNLFYSDAKELLIYYPSTKFAIEYKNIVALTEEEKQKLIRDQFDWGLDHYKYSVLGKGSVAGLKTEQLEFRAKNSSAFFDSGVTNIFDKFSFPVSGTYKFVDGSQYSFRFSKIEFNKPVEIAPLRPKLSPEVTLSRWDLSSKAISVAEINRVANFEFKSLLAFDSAPLPQSLKFNKIIRQEGAIPAFTFLYENRPYFLNVSVYKDYGLSALAPNKGFQMKSDKKGMLIIGPHSSSYSFVSKGTQYIMVGNIPFEEILELSKRI